MSQIKETHAEQLAAELFDAVVVPLAERRRSAGRPPFFPLSGEPGEESYFETPVVRVMQPVDFECPGGGTAEGLADALAAAWNDEGQPDLAAMAARLKAICVALRQEAAKADGSVSIFCYTLF